MQPWHWRVIALALIDVVFIATWILTAQEE